MEETWGEMDPYEKLEKYLEDEGYANIEREELTQQNFPDQIWRDGLPVLGHDVQLEEELGLPDDVIAVMGTNGVVHQAFNPFHSIMTEGILHD